MSEHPSNTSTLDHPEHTADALPRLSLPDMPFELPTLRASSPEPVTSVVYAEPDVGVLTELMPVPATDTPNEPYSHPSTSTAPEEQPQQPARSIAERAGDFEQVFGTDFGDSVGSLLLPEFGTGHSDPFGAPPAGTSSRRVGVERRGAPRSTSERRSAPTEHVAPGFESPAIEAPWSAQLDPVVSQAMSSPAAWYPEPVAPAEPAEPIVALEPAIPYQPAPQHQAPPVDHAPQEQPGATQPAAQPYEQPYSQTYEQPAAPPIAEAAHYAPHDSHVPELTPLAPAAPVHAPAHAPAHDVPAAPAVRQRRRPHVIERLMWMVVVPGLSGGSIAYLIDTLLLR